MATMPVKLSFREDQTPDGCVVGDLEQELVRINICHHGTAPWTTTKWIRLVLDCLGLVIVP